MDQKPRKFSERNFGVATFKYNRWSLDLEEGQTLDDVLDPSNWAHLAARLMGQDKANPKGRGDIIEIRKLETGLYAEAIVREVGPGMLKVQLLRAQEPEAVDVPEAAPLATKWNVGKRAHDVIRKSDNMVMAGGFQTKEKAAEWIADHMKAMAA